jgi:hypothetical protein
MNSVGALGDRCGQGKRRGHRGRRLTIAGCSPLTG